MIPEVIEEIKKFQASRYRFVLYLPHFCSMPEFLSLHPLVHVLVDSHTFRETDHNESFISKMALWPESRFCHACAIVRTDS